MTVYTCSSSVRVANNELRVGKGNSTIVITRNKNGVAVGRATVCVGCVKGCTSHLPYVNDNTCAAYNRVIVCGSSMRVGCGSTAVCLSNVTPTVKPYGGKNGYNSMAVALGSNRAGSGFLSGVALASGRNAAFSSKRGMVCNPNVAASRCNALA